MNSYKLSLLEALNSLEKLRQYHQHSSFHGKLTTEAMDRLIRILDDITVYQQDLEEKAK
jgi:hypothetical protein